MPLMIGSHKYYMSDYYSERMVAKDRVDMWSTGRFSGANCADGSMKEKKAPERERERGSCALVFGPVDSAVRVCVVLDGCCLSHICLPLPANHVLVFGDWMSLAEMNLGSRSYRLP